MACVSLGSMLCPAWNALADRLAAPRVRATVISIAAIIVFAIFLHQLRLYTATAAEHRDVWGENTNLVEFAFYYSTPVFFVAVAGIALMIFRVNSPGFAALLLMLLGSSVFLVWRNIDALHPWAARRWMIFLLPVFCAGAAYPAAWLWEMRRWWSRIISFVAAALLAALILLAAPQLNLSRNFHGAIASADTLAQHFRPDDLILTHPTGMIQQFSPYLNARHGVGFYTQQYNAESWRASMPVARASALMGRRALYVSDVPIPVDGSEPPPFFKQIMSVPIRYKYLPDGNHALPTTATAENMTFRIYQMDPERIPPGWWPEMATIPENIRQELPVELRMNAKADPFLTNFFKPVDLPDGRSIRWTDGSGRVRIGDLITFPIREGPVRISAELNSGRPELAAPLQVEWYLNPNIPSRAWHLGTTGVWAEWTRAGVDVDASMLRPDSIIELKTLRPSVGTVFPQGKLGVLVSSIRAD
ncbi:MAG: hypothetical protein NTY46_14050 [Candidatus Sumerlaeota bacterium]|nr:hypothetical protein [Candidatus Sumerlaeota bacterium]